MTRLKVIRALNGIFPVIKPHGITSAELLNNLKDKLHTELDIKDQSKYLKFGHGGTLDSTATGVLAVGVGYGCGKLKCLLHGEKNYEVNCQLGVATDTYNETGKVIMEKPFDHVTEEILKKNLHEFQGRIQQLPPLYSALKMKGRRYSDLTREGIEITVEPRKVFCYEAYLTSFNPPYFGLFVSSGPGFYIRSLIHDLGLAVGSCAHVRELQRTRHGPFTLKDSLAEENWSVENVVQAIKKFKKTINISYKEYRMANHKDKW